LFLEKLFFPIDQGIDVIRSELEAVAVGNRVRGAGFDAIPAENAARIINVVNAGVAFPRGNSAGIGIFGSFNVDAIRRASRGAEKASNALLEPRFVAMQYVNPAIARLKMHRFEGIILRDRFTKHIPEGHAESLNQCGKGLADFSKDGCHELGV
jgi:hypothetical protein